MPDKAGMQQTPELFVPFRFRISFSHQYAPGAVGQENSKNKFDLIACKGEFSEVTGLEFNTTPKKLKEGGRNWGEVQLTAPVTFSNLVLKRGITRDTELWRWYQFIYRTGVYAYRADCVIEVLESYDRDSVRMRWVARNCIPVKFKGADLNATSTSVAIEELHLAHEGLELEWVDATTPSSTAGGGNAT
ncbi:MAG: phage tail protein [Gammaproteobacteria bacterium]|nr:phage tail protein [Gammaproteobacteria bacterium]